MAAGTLGAPPQCRAGAGSIGVNRADSGTVARMATAMPVMAVATPKVSPTTPTSGGTAAEAAMAPV